MIDKKNEQQVLKEREKEEALASLKEMIPEGTTLTIVLKRISRDYTSSLYSVFIPYKGKVIRIDDLITNAGLFEYVISDSHPNGLKTNDVWKILNALSQKLFQRSNALKLDEVR